MLVSDEEVSDLKSWIVKKLEDISDADSDVLADYVLALIRAEAPDEHLKANAIENLEDFLRDHTTDFVNEVFRVIHAKSYIPGYVQPTVPSSSSPTLPIPTAPTTTFDPSPIRNGSFQMNPLSRKRSYNDANETRQGYDPHYGNGDRTMKQTRRGGGGPGFGRGNFNGGPQHAFPGVAPSGQGQLSGMPGIAPNMTLNPNDTMAAMMAMQAMGIPIPPLPGGGPRRGPGQDSLLRGGKTRVDARCRDYDTKGICLRGQACPFKHGDNSVVIPGPSEEYDPKTPTLGDFSTSLNGHSPTEDFRGRGGRARGRGFGDRGGHPNPRRPNRADFSMAGTNYDRSITTVVVEHIPEENFEESQVIDFFSAFGTIEEVTMKPYKRLALVKFDNYHSAKAAYDSPRVIFDNRFVKVYWYKPDAITAPSPANGTAAPPNAISPTSASAPTKPEEPPFDKEKFQRDAEAAQKKLEERKALQAETDAKLAEIEKKQAELAKKRGEEIQRMKEKLAAKSQSTPSSTVDADKDQEKTTNGGENGESDKKSANTASLLAQLKALEDEARSLGLDPETHGSPGRGRGSFSAARGRGRGSYMGYDPSYSSYRGGGGFRAGRGGSGSTGPYRGAVRAGGAYNLDNRPRSVKVEGGGMFDEAREEGLRSFLFTVGEYTSTTPSPSKDAMTVTFKDRFTAEKFFYGPKDIPGVGPLEFSWVANQSVPSTSTSTPAVSGMVLKDGDTQMGGTSSGIEEGRAGAGGASAINGGGEVRGREIEREDYDVAEEDDWIA